MIVHPQPLKTKLTTLRVPAVPKALVLQLGPLQRQLLPCGGNDMLQVYQGSLSTKSSCVKSGAGQ